MSHLSTALPGLLTVSLALVMSVPPLSAQVDYRRAEQMLSWNLAPLITGDVADPEWMKDGNRFWYRVPTSNGPQFILVDPVRDTERPLFDNVKLAAAMSLANNEKHYEPGKLPFRTFEFVDGEQGIEFEAGDEKLFRCDITAYHCSIRKGELRPPTHVLSPDGDREAFIDEYNLHVRPASGGEAIQLTTDGVRYWAYGVTDPTPSQIIKKTKVRPVLEWSPDSRKIVVQRMDERNVEHMHLYSSTHQRPMHYSYPYALPGDANVPRFDIHIIDVGSKANIKVQSDPQPSVSSLSGVREDQWVTVKWSKSSDKLYFTHINRGPKRVRLMEADASTGTVRRLVEESSATYVELMLSRGPPNWTVANNGDDVIWFSERDGWAHLYRYDAKDNLKNQITSGASTVGNLLHVDEAAGQIYFTARGREPGRDPYWAHLYSTDLEGSRLQLLTQEEANHNVAFSPSGNYVVDTYSSVDKPPVTVLRSPVDGKVIRKLEEADISGLLATSWRMPEPFTVKARDGTTDLYGVMYKPSDFDPAKKYPIIDNIYPGPQTIVRQRNFSPSNGEARARQVHALAELGFIVVHIEAMGTNFRSKAFHDTWYGNMGDNGIPDHIAALKQLGARHSFIDLDRVGIYGHSGGGFASTDAILRYPNFFKVAVSSAGNHDNRSYRNTWAEKYQGLLEKDEATGKDNYENQVNYLLADNLKGKLLLVHGDMDDNVHPAMTLQVIDALIKANKKFDFMIMPDRAHSFTQDPYFIRLLWDYFVEHLLHVEPPADYEIKKPEDAFTPPQ